MSLKKTPFFELRSGTVDLLHFVVKTANLADLRTELARRFESTPAFFSGESVAVDLRRLPAFGDFEMARIEALLGEFRMRSAGVVIDTQDPQQRAWAERQNAPLLESRERSGARADDGADESETDSGSGDAAGNAQERVADSASAAAASAASAAAGAAARAAVPTMIVERPLRSGQRIYAEGDLVVLGQVSNGAEVIAEGNIHVYAPLRGRALAGVHGNHAARIFCTCLEPELISIAGIYRTTENPLAADIQGKPVQVRLDEEKLIFEALRLT